MAEEQKNGAVAEEQQGGTTAVAERKPQSAGLFEQMEREFEDMRRRMMTMFRRPFAAPAPAAAPAQEATTLYWAPTADMYEQDGRIVIKAELPGVKSEDVSVTFEDGVLTVEGKREEAKEIKEAKYYASERFSGAFSRSFALPKGIEADKIEAEFKDGVLNVTMPAPTRPAVEPTRVPIKS